MAQLDESSFGELLDGAVEEAVSEVDAVEGDDVFEPEDVIEEEPTSEQDSEDTDDDEVEFTDDEAADEPETEELEEVARATFEQTGNPDDLPPELVKSYKLMQAGFTKKMQELGERDRQRDELHRKALQNLETQQKTLAVEADKRPANPTNDMAQADIDKRYEEIGAWQSRQAIREAVERGEILAPGANQAQEDPLEANGYTRSVNNRIQLIGSQDGYSEEIGVAMGQLTQQDPWWNQQAKTDEGALKLFQYVKQEHDAVELRKQAAELENARVKRSAGAAKRASPNPTTQSKAVATAPADNFANMGFGDKLDAIIGEDFGP